MTLRHDPVTPGNREYGRATTVLVLYQGRRYWLERVETGAVWGMC